MRVVCKAWSVPSRHIPAAAVDKFQIPWALRRKTYQLFDPFSGEKIVGGKEGRRLIFESFYGRPGGNGYRLPSFSTYGWVLFAILAEREITMHLLYSPFTSEIIKLPVWNDRPEHQVSGLALDATSPRCVVILLALGRAGDKIHVWLCSPGDRSWRRIDLNSGIEPCDSNCACSAVYVNGVLYCSFRRGELGAFNVELEEWTILGRPLLPRPFSVHHKLILIDADFWVFNHKKLYRFDCSEERWVYQESLNKHGLFLGPSSFAVFMTSQAVKDGRENSSSTSLRQQNVQVLGFNFPGLVFGRQMI